MFWGAAFIIVGAIILLNRLDVIDLQIGEYLMPVILIAWGVKIMSSRKDGSK